MGGRLRLGPAGPPVILLVGGYVTAAMLIWGVAILTVAALVRGRSAIRSAGKR